ncbi:uncharacterized protein [Primulina eburnea]|uniref:uncharacterized protein n=1 Tax=Primulina eburnea TaxID=1245227 RepID=UPI003C6C30EE
MLMNMMREFTGQRDLIRPAKTRFATGFLTMRSSQQHKQHLRKIFTSENWSKSKFAKEQTGKQAQKIILMPSFWNSIIYAMKVGGPLLKLHGGTHMELRHQNCKNLPKRYSCERNWSVFEHLHSKKRNRLEQKHLNDLVFIKYNRALRRRYDSRDTIDPIILTEVDDGNEWLLGRPEDEEPDFVHDVDDLTWQDVADVVGVDEVPYTLRKSKRPRRRPLHLHEARRRPHLSLEGKGQ